MKKLLYCQKFSDEQNFGLLRYYFEWFQREMGPSAEFQKNKFLRNILDKVFMNRPSKICGRQPLVTWSVKQTITFKFFKGCLPQISLGQFLNTLPLIKALIIRYWQIKRITKAISWHLHKSFQRKLQSLAKYLKRLCFSLVSNNHKWKEARSLSPEV